MRESMEFIERLDLLLKDRKISKMQFLKDTGYSKNAYSEWKSGVTKSYMNKIDTIADYFGVSVDYLIGRTDDPAPATDAIDSEFSDMELSDILDALKNRDEMRMLFSLTKDATKEDVLQAVKIIEALKK